MQTIAKKGYIFKKVNQKRRNWKLDICTYEYPYCPLKQVF